MHAASAVRAQAPTLPPTSPLPPPPRPHTANGSSPSRSASIIGRRLRILSSPPSTAPSNSRPAIDDFADQYTGIGPISIPESPIIPGPITTLQNNGLSPPPPRVAAGCHPGQGETSRRGWPFDVH
ncbi:hypothetical protein BC629DRAFT_318364 [Irpex lacteus]|nr:hypothetical protein BC629DRAFT_318364 [Irpex lacteus]